MHEPNEIRIARMHLKDALERKEGKHKAYGNEDYIIDLCKQRIAEYENTSQNSIQSQSAT